MELLFQNFVIIWLSIGSIILFLMYMNQTSSKKIYFFISSLLVASVISFSIYREHNISFRAINGYPKEEVRFIAYNITLSNNKPIIGLWAYNINKKTNSLYRFDWDLDAEKILKEAIKRQKSGSSTILQMIKTPSLDGIPSGSKMIGKIERVEKMPAKEKPTNGRPF